MLKLMLKMLVRIWLIFSVPIIVITLFTNKYYECLIYIFSYWLFASLPIIISRYKLWPLNYNRKIKFNNDSFELNENGKVSKVLFNTIKVMEIYDDLFEIKFSDENKISKEHIITIHRESVENSRNIIIEDFLKNMMHRSFVKIYQGKSSFE
jgi:hypothetical protein